MLGNGIMLKGFVDQNTFDLEVIPQTKVWNIYWNQLHSCDNFCSY